MRCAVGEMVACVAGVAVPGAAATGSPPGLFMAAVQPRSSEGEAAAGISIKLGSLGPGFSLGECSCLK